MATAASFQDPSGGKSADILEGRFLVSSEIACAMTRCVFQVAVRCQYGWPTNGFNTADPC
jgi:hypothetical protein